MGGMEAHATGAMADCKGARAELEMREFLRDPQKFGMFVIERHSGKLGGFAEIRR